MDLGVQFHLRHFNPYLAVHGNFHFGGVNQPLQLASSQEYVFNNDLCLFQFKRK